MKLGVDTGGTFTDFVWLDENGRLRIHKQLSTPQDPSAAILAGIDHIQLPLTAEVIHGTTVATNALLERKGARTALITTKGFADVLAIGRQNRPALYALVPQKPAPLIPKAWRFEVDERVTAQGEVLRPLNTATLAPLLDQINSAGIESAAICLLFSFLYPKHEQQIAAYLRQHAPHLHLSLSSEILPEYREYERTATTVINAFVAPIMAKYLSRLAENIKPRRLSVMQSNGGIISAETAASQAARTALSGPAGGVVGARFIAEQAGFANIITFDMGGTSTDVALCPGKLPTTARGSIADLPLRLPIIDIHTVGAGGGSLAMVDAGGALHVGPQSAGADPGPMCYGRYPEQLRVTTTDANLLLGRLDAHHFLGGHMTLDEEAARAGLTHLARQLGAASAEEAAWGVVQVANAGMERAVRKISVERGYDPRLFTLVPFGGAGPLHACELAQNLQIPRVLVPPVPGVLSAMGMLVAAPTKDYSLTVMQLAAECTLADLRAVFMPMVARAQAEMAQEGHTAVTCHYSLDMRYHGQSHELTIGIELAEGEDVLAKFHAAHENRYGYQQPEAAVELVNARVTAVAPVLPPELPATPIGRTDAAPAKIGEKLVWFRASQPVRTQLYDREKLRPGMQFVGPAVVFQYDTTVVVPPAWETAVDPTGNLLLHHKTTQ
jgi:N-methylhydantoinase A